MESYLPALQPLHPDHQLLELKLAQFRRVPTDTLLASLRPGQTGALKTRGDGTILDGHHRIKVLRERGKNVAIHCRQGIGRSGLFAASLLVSAGVDPAQAFQQIERARGVAVPDTPEQRQWVEKFARMIAIPVGQ